MTLILSKVEKGTLNGFVQKHLLVFLISHLLIRLWCPSLHTMALRSNLQSCSQLSLNLLVEAWYLNSNYPICSACFTCDNRRILRNVSPRFATSQHLRVLDVCILMKTNFHQILHSRAWKAFKLFSASKHDKSFGSVVVMLLTRTASSFFMGDGHRQNTAYCDCVSGNCAH